ncbi:MAG: carbohydrate binding family 9 domain-containing protein [Chitinophagales bacterium]|nr:carbohydrate binding family 9 domain-containing protein [Chitinophagales bacterium]
MKKYSLLFLLCMICIVPASMAQGSDSIPRKKYTTARLKGVPIVLDGIPSEETWNGVEWGGDFTQWQPAEGKPPSQPTRFKILYDDRFLYIAYDCIDKAADSIDKRMGRRDAFPGDFVEINIDSYHDKRTAFSFTLSVSGVRGDEFVSNDGDNWDENWNPIWYAKTHIHKGGWTAEVKIPLSQLRYGNEKDKVWGIQIMRRIFRKEERSTWQFIPQNSGVWVSRFGELHGLKDIPFHRQVEIAPYVTVQADKYKKEAGNPFADGFDAKLTGGLDGKVAVTNDLILDFTINPDFGQVEADPSQVRIDGFQNFFSERRPFFIESSNIFDYQITGSAAGGDYDSDLLFYSRRIGSSPHGYPNTNSGEYVKYPQNTSILGAAKFSGKTKKGWSIGVLESVTEREKATIDDHGKRRKELVEPFTNYFVGRLQKDINKGNTVIGGIFTAVNREHGLDDILHRSAYSGGIDFLHFWKRRTWYIRGNFIYSRVNGSKEAILNTQTTFEHLFQRSGAKEVSVDSSRTSLTGTGGTFRIGKSGGKAGKMGQVLRFETGVTLRSPELELNDMGFMLTANEINHWTWIGLHYQRPFSMFRNARLNYNHWFRWDYGGQLLYEQYNFNSHATFRNNWQSGTGVTWNPYDVSNNALRGAGSMRRPPGIGWTYYVNSDYRKKVYGQVNLFKWWGFDNSMIINSAGLTVNIVPFNALNISIGANYNRNWRRQDQYVSQVAYNGTNRTIVGEVDQTTVRFTGRLTYNLTPDLTIQYYGQPFITRPKYNHFAWVSNALTKDLDDRFTRFTPNQISFNNGTYFVDENGDGNTDYSFAKPDFNFVQFRSNLVVRWEYRPGSEFYLVWSQGNTSDAYDELDTPIFSSLFNNAFSGSNNRNIFLLKFTYRFLR